MADIIPSLFGLTPEMYGQQQQMAALSQGAQLANMSPEARGAAMTYAGAAGLGRAVGGMLGAEDPQLKLITARNSIINQLDQTDPTSLIKGAQMLASMGDQQGAFALADYARKAQSEVAQAQQRIAAANRERSQAMPADVQIASQIASITDGLDQLRNQPASPERNRAMNILTTQLTELQRLTTRTDKQQTFGAEREAISKEMFKSSYGDLTQEQMSSVNKRIEEEQGRKAEKGAPKVYTPGQPIQPKDWMDFSQKVLSGDPIMQRTSTIISDAPSAIDIIRNSTSNDFAAASLPTSIAMLTGQGKNMSNADVNRFARTGGLDDRLAQDAVKFFTGGTTEVKKDQAERFAIALYRGALLERKKKLQDSAKEFGYDTSPNYKIALENIDKQLGQFKLVKKGETTPSAQKTGNPLIDKYLFPQAENK